MYLVHAPPLIDAGYAPLPLIPRSKIPGRCERGYWRPFEGWVSAPTIDPRACDDVTRESVRGAGIGVLLGPRSRNLVCVDIDDATEEERAALVAALPPTDIRCRGRRGEKLFYTCPDVVTKQFRIRGRLVAEILGAGRQVGLPPSVHPITGQSYAWSGGETLQNGALPRA
jgi:Bifunctional DNA primase/polymerase, N-terminal